MIGDVVTDPERGLKKKSHQYTAAWFQTPEGILRVDFVCELAFHQDFFRRALLRCHAHATRLKADGHLRAQRERVRRDDTERQQC